MFLAVYNVAWFIFQVFMCRQGFTLKYTTGTKFRRCFYTTVCVICFIFCKTGEEQCAVCGPASFQRAPKSISMCAPVCESVFCGCVCSCFFSTEMSDSLLVRNCLCASRQHVRVCMCMSVVNYGGRRGVDRLSPLECICIWNSKVRTNVFLSGRVPEGSREISLSYFTCQTLKRDRWEPVRDACEPVGLLRSQLPIHNHRHRIPQRKGMVGRAEVRYKTAFWIQTQTDL